MDWIEIGKNHLSAAKSVIDGHPRSAASRAYYAAHVVLADALSKAGYICPAGRQTPPHGVQAQLIGVHLAGIGEKGIRELRAVFVGSLAGALMPITGEPQQSTVQLPWTHCVTHRVCL